MKYGTIAGIALVVFVIALIILGPLATIFSVNTLFGTAWSYSFANWFSVVWLINIFYGLGRVIKK